MYFVGARQDEIFGGSVGHLARRCMHRHFWVSSNLAEYGLLRASRVSCHNAVRYSPLKFRLFFVSINVMEIIRAPGPIHYCDSSGRDLGMAKLIYENSDVKKSCGTR
jgi:hypothetical protein